MMHIETNMVILPSNGTINDTVDQIYGDIHRACNQENMNWFDENDEKFVSLLDERCKALDARNYPNIKLFESSVMDKHNLSLKNNCEKFLEGQIRDQLQ